MSLSEHEDVIALLERIQLDAFTTGDGPPDLLTASEISAHVNCCFLAWMNLARLRLIDRCELVRVEYNGNTYFKLA